MSTLGTAGCFPAEGQLSHLSTCPKVCTDAHLLQGWETLFRPTSTPATTQSGISVPAAQAEDIMFWCSESSRNVPKQLAFLVDFLLQAIMCSAASLSLAFFFCRL